MLIGVISDTHGYYEGIKQAADAAGSVDLWLHCGDFAADGETLAALTDVPVLAVRGNCDMMTEAKEDEYIDIGLTKIWVTHGHRYHPQTLARELAVQALQKKVAVVCYGHTHMAYNCRHEGVLVFNPGSPVQPRGGGFPSCGILSVDEDGTVNGNIVRVAKITKT